MGDLVVMQVRRQVNRWRLSYGSVPLRGGRSRGAERIFEAI
jgi:hypothetical protein